MTLSHNYQPVQKQKQKTASQEIKEKDIYLGKCVDSSYIVKMSP